MEKGDVVKLEWKDGELIIYDQTQYVTGNRAILPVTIISPGKPARHYIITKTKKGGFLFQ